MDFDPLECPAVLVEMVQARLCVFQVVAVSFSVKLAFCQRMLIFLRDRVKVFLDLTDFREKCKFGEKKMRSPKARRRAGTVSTSTDQHFTVSKPLSSPLGRTAMQKLQKDNLSYIFSLA